MDKKLFEKYLSNTCSSNELDLIVKLIKDDDLTGEWQKWAKEEWQKKQEPELLNESDLSMLLDKIHHKININNQVRLNNKLRISVFISKIGKVAAILFLPVLSILLYLILKISPELENYSCLTSDSIEIVTPVGSRSVIQLEDGTEVYLNFGSKLKYPQKFRGNKRKVTLTGEAYFKVAHNPGKPFVVQTNNLNIVALGTEFNVSAYPDERNIETTLVKGKVKIESVNKKGKPDDIATMIPGQHLVYNQENGNVQTDQSNIEKYIAWRDGKMVFKDESIVVVARKLERFYGVEFEFADKESMQITYTATFVDEGLFQILDLLKLATPIEYKVIARKKLPDGTFSKQKIIIKSR